MGENSGHFQIEKWAIHIMLKLSNKQQVFRIRVLTNPISGLIIPKKR